MGKSLKHLVVAEGIETQEQRAYLQTQRCTEGQGYLFSRPLAAAQFAHLLQMGLTETAVH
jgi:EAL domain-containing protein (putative c-di-GMP-specific phosphodiesterase class I)